MKNMTRSILLLLAAFATAAIYGGEPAPGVAGVDVIVKQTPSKRAVTDARGNFSIDALPPGSYTLSFRSRNANDTKAAATSKVTIAQSYSIRVEGTKRSVNESGLTSDKFLAGVDLAVQVAAGAKVRGQVLAGAMKKMVWIEKEPGSHIPGHWAEEGTAAAARSNVIIHSREDMRELMSRQNPNMTDPMGSQQTSGR